MIALSNAQASAKRVHLASLGLNPKKPNRDRALTVWLIGRRKGFDDDRY